LIKPREIQKMMYQIDTSKGYMNSSSSKWTMVNTQYFQALGLLDEQFQGKARHPGNACGRNEQ
jgi:hypothetical protein